jgi:hypothetical protein
MLLKITTLDTDGFNGRDFPPSQKDLGKVVVVVGCDTLYVDAQSEMHPMLAYGVGFTPWSEEARRAAKAAIDDTEAKVLVTCWKVMTWSGKVLQCMDHEVEVFRA